MRRRWSFWGLALAGLGALGGSARGENILSFGKSEANATAAFVSTVSGNVTTLSTRGVVGGSTVDSAPITVTLFAGSPTAPFEAYLTFVNVRSVGPAGSVVVGGQSYLGQSFAGTIAITSGVGATGTNYLTATFDEMVASVSGQGQALNFFLGASAETAAEGTHLVMSSDVLTVNTLVQQLPRDFSITVGDLNTPFTTVGSGANRTIGAFTASNVGGQYNAGAVNPQFVAPEPSTLALAGLSLLGGLGALRRKARRTVA